MNSLFAATPPGSSARFHDTIDFSGHWWFAALDQRWFATGADRCLTQVVGIHESGQDVWIQLQTLGEQLRDFTIRVQPGMDLADVVRAIEKQIRPGLVSALAK